MSNYKIAIYGDSFGSGFGFKVSESGKKQLEYIGHDWTEILSTKYNVTNFSEFSSSLVFSVNTFEKTHVDFDKVIFLITHPGRVTMGNPNKNQPTKHFVNYDASKLWTSRAKSEDWIRELNAVLDYYYFIYDDGHENTIHTSLVNYIKTLRSDTILVPNFKNSFNHIHGDTLVDIFEKENKHWGIEYPIFDYDMRKCHLTKENNEILAYHVDKWINGEPVLIDVKNFTIPSVPKELYIFKSLL